MSATKATIIHCDGADPADNDPARIKRCDNSFLGHEAEPTQNVRRRAKAAGWSSADGAWDYCPRHSTKARRAGA